MFRSGVVDAAAVTESALLLIALITSSPVVAIAREVDENEKFPSQRSR